MSHRLDETRAARRGTMLLLVLALGAGLAGRFQAAESAAPTAAATAAALPPGAADSALALFQGGAVFPTEFAHLWGRLLIAEHPPGSEEESRRTYLLRIVDRKLLAREVAKYPVTLTDGEERDLQTTRNTLAQNMLFQATVANLPEPTERELEIFTRRQKELAEARFINFADWDRARLWRSRLLTGTPMTVFEAAIRREGAALATVDSFRLMAAEQIPDTLATVIWSLQPGQLSEVHSFSGHPVLIHVRAFHARPNRLQALSDIKADYRRLRYDTARERTRHELAAAVGRVFKDEGMDVLLAAHLRMPPRSDVDSVSGMPTIRPELPVPTVAPADTGRVVAVTKDGEVTIGAYLRYWITQPPISRPDVRERAVLEGSVDRVALAPEILRRALAEGYGQDSISVAILERRREGFAMDHYFRDQIESRIKLTEKDLRAYWEKDPAHYNDRPSADCRIIVVDRQSLADSILVRLRGGASFAEMVRAYSTDPSTAEKEGRVGVIFRGTQRNAGFEDAVFATKVGELGGPVFTPEGWIVWKLDAKTPGLERSFEEARPMVERDARIVEGERLLEAKLVELRKKAKVKLFPERIPQALTRSLF